MSNTQNKSKQTEMRQNLSISLFYTQTHTHTHTHTLFPSFSPSFSSSLSLSPSLSSLYLFLFYTRTLSLFSTRTLAHFLLTGTSSDFLSSSSPRVNFTYVLRAAFTLVGPKNAKWHCRLDCFFTYSGSMCIKAVRRMLMKLSPEELSQLLHVKSKTFCVKCISPVTRFRLWTQVQKRFLFRV